MQQPDGAWLIGRELVSIHTTALDAPEFAVLAQHGAAGIVWSPLSNFLLYGDTTKVAAAKKSGVAIAIGSDWAPSGTKNLLGELKIAKLVSDHHGGLFSDKELVEAVTSTPARMLGWAPFVGSIEPNKTADLLVLDNSHRDPYVNPIQATEANAVAVIIDGLPRAGRATVIDPRTPGVELIRIARQDIVLDIVETSNHPLAGVSLASAITTMTWALANLPDVAREAITLAPFMRGAPDQWRPIPDYDDDSAHELKLFAAPPPGPGDVEPMTIEPMTAVDDADFVSRASSAI